MKLIRVVSEKEDGSFDNDFDDNFLKENASIGLHNITASLLPDSIELNTTNNKFSFSIAGNVISVNLSSGTFTKSNYPTLLNEIEKKLNAGLTFSGKQIGVQFKVQQTNDKVNIGYKSSPYNLNERLVVLKPDVSFGGSIANRILGALSNNNVNDDSRMMNSDVEFVRGCGVMRSQIVAYTDTGGAGNGLIYGLTKKRINELSNPLSLADNFFSLSFGSGGVMNYDVNADGSTTNSSVPVAINDIIEIRITEGRLEAVVYKGGVENIIETMSIHSDEIFYPFISFRTGRDKLKLKNLRIQFNPYLLPINYVLESDDDLLTAPQRPTPHLSVNNILTFDNSSSEGINLNKFLGFDELSYTQKSPNPNFLANRRFEFHIFNDTYLLVLDNIQLNSYDGFKSPSNTTGHRRNILAVIPYKNDNTGSDVLEYETNNINFIDIRNSEKLNLRRIRGRILRSDLQPIRTNGLMSITFLIKE